jgi:heme-degrading monooxygenase HmoA
MSEITRVVRLSFDHQKIEDFIAIFNHSKSLIRNFPGCIHLELMHDQDHNHVYYTVSKWQSYEALEAYRSSSLFLDTWKKTKVLFNSKPQAFSMSMVTKM